MVARGCLPSSTPTMPRVGLPQSHRQAWLMGSIAEGNPVGADDCAGAVTDAPEGVPPRSDPLMNIGDPWPDLDQAEWRVLQMQRKLHLWATSELAGRFDDLYNLVYDPAFLVVAWESGQGEQGLTFGWCGWSRSVLHPVRRWGVPQWAGRRPQSSAVHSNAGAGEDDPQGEREVPPPWHPHGPRIGPVRLAPSLVSTRRAGRSPRLGDPRAHRPGFTRCGDCGAVLYWQRRKSRKREDRP